MVRCERPCALPHTASHLAHSGVTGRLGRDQAARWDSQLDPHGREPAASKWRLQPVLVLPLVSNSRAFALWLGGRLLGAIYNECANVSLEVSQLRWSALFIRMWRARVSRSQRDCADDGATIWPIALPAS